MLKLNQNYSDYTDETDVNYPEGKAVNASTSESYDGTPLLAEFMNDVNAAHIAMYEKAHGSRDGISGQADTQKASQFADSVAKYTDDKVKAHADERGLADGVHGATSDATPGQIVSRDEFGRAKFGAPVDDTDAARKVDVDNAKASVVAGVFYDSENKKIQQIIGKNSSDVVTVATLKEAMNLADDVVDVVEDRNMHAVSSNAVNKALKDYGTFICSLGAAAAKTINIGVTLSDGITCKVMFLNGHYSSETADIMTLNDKKIYVNKFGSAALFKGHKIGDDNKYFYINSYVTVELVYMTSLDGGIGGWMIIGNPTVVSGVEQDIRYEIKSDGLITQSGFFTASSNLTNPRIGFALSYEEKPVINTVSESSTAYTNSTSIGYAIVKDYQYWTSSRFAAINRCDTSGFYYDQILSGRIIHWSADGY